MNQNEKKPQMKHIVKLCSALFLTLFFFKKQVINIFIQSVSPYWSLYFYSFNISSHFNIIKIFLHYVFPFLELNFASTRTDITQIYYYSGAKFKSWNRILLKKTFFCTYHGHYFNQNQYCIEFQWGKIYLQKLISIYRWFTHNVLCHVFEQVFFFFFFF